MLTALFLGPATGYSLTKLVSGTYFGERYYYEVYFALCLLAARGLVLLGNTRGRGLLPSALAVCLTVYCLHATVYAREAIAAFDPHAAVLSVARQLTEPSSVVFLPLTWGRDTNMNAPRWRDAPVVYLEDPGEPSRAPLVRVLGRRTWYVIAYDTAASQAIVVRNALP